MPATRKLGTDDLRRLANSADTALNFGLTGLQAIGDLALNHPDDIGNDHELLTGLGYFLQDYAGLLNNVRDVGGLARSLLAERGERSC